MFYGHNWFLWMLPGLIIGLYAQLKLWSTYSRYSRVAVQSGATGAEAAREVLDRAGLDDVPVQEVPGQLTDHYDPTKRALFLSTDNFHGRSLAAVGVAAHEAGHALQHKTGYALLGLRMTLVPVTQFASYAWSGILLLGLFLGGPFFAKVIWLVVGIFAILTLFQLVTLPVELDASRRAKEQLLQLGLVRPQEQEAVKAVLGAAALTYVAGLVSAVMELLRFLAIARNRD